MLVFQSDRLAAVCAKFRLDDIKDPAVVAEHFRRVERVNLDFCTTLLAVRTQVFKALKVAAFALPVPDLVFDKFEGCGFTEIRNQVKSCTHGDTRCTQS